MAIVTVREYHGVRTIGFGLAVKVRVRFGVYSSEMIALTPRDCYERIGELWGIPVNAVPYTGPQRIGWNEQLTEGRVVEFFTPR